MSHRHKRHHAPRRTPKQALFRLARKRNPEPEHAFQVRKNAERLFAALAPLHGLGDAAWHLLETSSLLHDIGTRHGMRRHHKRSRDMILAQEWPGLSKDDRAIVACVARYHRKGLPHPGHRVYRDLTPEQQQMVRQLAGLLRVADGLDRTHHAAVCAIQGEHDAHRVILRVGLRRDSPEDIRGALAKADLFEQEFARTLEIVGFVDRG